MIAITTLIWFFVTILMMGFFAGVEMAFYSANRFGIELKKKTGKAKRYPAFQTRGKPGDLPEHDLTGFYLVPRVLCPAVYPGYLSLVEPH